MMACAKGYQLTERVVDGLGRRQNPSLVSE